MQRETAQSFACRYDINQGSFESTKVGNSSGTTLNLKEAVTSGGINSYLTRPHSAAKYGKPKATRQSESELALRTMAEKSVSSLSFNEGRDSKCGSVYETRRESKKGPKSSSSSRTLKKLHSLNRLTSQQIGDR